MIYFLWLSDQMDHLVQMELYAPMESMVHMALFFSLSMERNPPINGTIRTIETNGAIGAIF